MHVTTRITDHPYDGLLKEKGFRGFPSLAFMDATGEVLAVQSDRTVEGFHKTQADVKAYANLKQRIDKGEKGLGVKLMKAEWDLGKLTWAEAKKKAEGFGKLSAKEKKQVTQIVLDAEVVERAMDTRDVEKFKAVYARFKQISGEGYVPGGKAERAFWFTMLEGSDKANDLKMYRHCVERVKEMLADNKRAEKYLQGLDERLAEMEEASAGSDA